MYAQIECTCGWLHEAEVQNQKSAEVIANTHEARDIRRPYRHETTIMTKEKIG